MSFDARDYSPESNKADCGHMFAGPRLMCVCELEFCASECLSEHQVDCVKYWEAIGGTEDEQEDCPYDHEPECTCRYIDVDLVDSTDCELHNERSGWNVERRAWDRAHAEPDTRPFADGPVEVECPF